jgi:hypothetical protein
MSTCLRWCPRDNGAAPGKRIMLAEARCRCRSSIRPYATRRRPRIGIELCLTRPIGPRLSIAPGIVTIESSPSRHIRHDRRIAVSSTGRVGVDSTPRPTRSRWNRWPLTWLDVSPWACPPFPVPSSAVSPLWPLASFSVSPPSPRPPCVSSRPTFPPVRPPSYPSTGPFPSTRRSPFLHPCERRYLG